MFGDESVYASTILDDATPISRAYIIEMVRGGIIDGLEGSVAWIEGTHSDCLWVLFLDLLYIHRDAKIIIVRVGFLKSAIVENRRDLLTFTVVIRYLMDLFQMDQTYITFGP